MQRRDIRDERAVLWTLEALTDNTELLPFVETIHDIVYGPAGFRRVDDHLFRLVLQTADSHTSLPRRILALLWSAETLPHHDPLRSRRQHESLRALWALGIVAARTSRSSARVVYGIDESSLHPLTMPEMYRLSLDAVIKYVHLRSIQTRFEDIGALFALHDIAKLRERRRLIRILRSSFPGLEADVRARGMTAPEIHAALRSLSQISNSDVDDLDNYECFKLGRRVVGDLNTDPLWQVHRAHIAVGLLSASLSAGVAPYRLLATCEEILLEVPTFPAHLQHPQPIFDRGPEQLPDSLQLLLGGDSPNDLDVIMQCGLRLLPLLDAANFVPIIHWYVANRSRKSDIFEYVFADCNLDVLAAAILRHLRAGPGISDATLRGLATLCLWRKDFAKVLDCEDVFAILETNSQAHPNPAYLTVKSIISSASLSALASKIAESRPKHEWTGSDVPDPSMLGAMQEVASHPLLHGTVSEGLEGSALVDTLDLIVSKISDLYAAGFIGLLSACTAPAQLPYEAQATVKHLCREWDPFLIANMSAGSEFELAHAILELIECACDSGNSRRAEVGSIVQGLWEFLGDTLRDNLTDATSTSVIAQALSLYRTSGAELGSTDQDYSLVETP